MSKATKQKPPLAVAPDNAAELEAAVRQTEQDFTQSTPQQLVDLINADTRGVLTLFPYAPRDVQEGKSYPALTGYLDTRRVKIPVSAFTKHTEAGRLFLSLSIGPKGQAHLGGALFRQEEQDAANGLWKLAPGKENDRYGVLGRTVKIDGSDEYQTLFELRCQGKRRLSRAGQPYIKAAVYPLRKAAAVEEGALEACF